MRGPLATRKKKGANYILLTSNVNIRSITVLLGGGQSIQVIGSITYGNVSLAKAFHLINKYNNVLHVFAAGRGLIIHKARKQELYFILVLRGSKLRVIVKQIKEGGLKVKSKYKIRYKVFRANKRKVYIESPKLAAASKKQH